MFTPPEVAKRISETAEAAGISVRALLIQAGLGKNTMSNMRNGSALQYDSLAKVASILGCSMDYLVGFTDSLNIGNSCQIDEREADMLKRYRALDFGGKARVDAYVDGEYQKARLEGDSEKAAT